MPNYIIRDPHAYRCTHTPLTHPTMRHALNHPLLLKFIYARQTPYGRLKQKLEGLL